MEVAGSAEWGRESTGELVAMLRSGGKRHKSAGELPARPRGFGSPLTSLKAAGAVEVQKRSESRDEGMVRGREALRRCCELERVGWR